MKASILSVLVLFTGFIGQAYANQCYSLFSSPDKTNAFFMKISSQHNIHYPQLEKIVTAASTWLAQIKSAPENQIASFTNNTEVRRIARLLSTLNITSPLYNPAYTKSNLRNLVQVLKAMKPSEPKIEGLWGDLIDGDEKLNLLFLTTYLLPTRNSFSTPLSTLGFRLQENSESLHWQKIVQLQTKGLDLLMDLLNKESRQNHRLNGALLTHQQNLSALSQANDGSIRERSQQAYESGTLLEEILASPLIRRRIARVIEKKVGFYIPTTSEQVEELLVRESHKTLALWTDFLDEAITNIEEYRLKFYSLPTRR